MLIGYAAVLGVFGAFAGRVPLGAIKFVPAGIAGIFGGLFSSPLIAVMLILEIAGPGGHRFTKT